MLRLRVWRSIPGYLMAMCLAGGMLASSWPGSATIADGPDYTGMSEASGVAVIDNDLFVVASDEDTKLRVYSRAHPGRPVKVVDFRKWLGATKDEDGIDIEAGARVGDRIYWMGSHSQGRNPKSVATRSCFFATGLRMAGGEVELDRVGEPYRRLLEDIASAPALADLLDGTPRAKSLKQLGKLEIEALAAGPEGSLLIGFRGPLRRHRALVLPLENPDGVVRGERARLGAIQTLDLDGLGIRDFVKTDRGYLVMGGPSGDKGRFQLFAWDGPGVKPVAISGLDFGTLHPEGIAVFGTGAGAECLVLSDDGRLDWGDTKQGKNLRFRTAWIRF